MSQEASEKTEQNGHSEQPANLGYETTFDGEKLSMIGQSLSKIPDYPDALKVKQLDVSYNNLM